MNRAAPWIKAMNVVLTPTIVNRRNKVDKVIARAVRDAEAKTGGTSSGDEAYIEEMRFLLRCFADVPDLTATGWIGTVQDLNSRIENRFRIRKLHAQHPEIGDELIERPIVVVGLPRTGTTFTHQVLAEARDHRAPLLWELLHTDLDDIPQPVKDRYHKQAEQLVRGTEMASPMFPLIHKMGADRPEECVFVLPHGLIFVVRAHMPRYEQWMLDRDPAPDYRYLKQALQVLQHGRKRHRWVLKSPAHLWNLDALLKVFPDAQVVWTHRDPATVLASMCSLAETSMSMHVREPDPAQIGRIWLGMLATGVGRANAARAHLADDVIIDVPYRHLTDEATERIPELFTRLDAPWSRAERANLEMLLARPDSGGRRHVYDLARYGVTRAEVEQAFGDYGDFVESLGR